MKKRVLVLVLAVVLAMTAPAYAGSKSDKATATAIAESGGYTVEKVVTVSNGGYKGKVKGTGYTVKYPKRVKKGKRVTVYMVVDGDDIVAMVCLGKVK